MKDDSIMPFGKHKGKPLADVPGEYFHWLWGENVEEFKYLRTRMKMAVSVREVMQYIEDSFPTRTDSMWV
jgi:uncharacterized protein (DUF3820 family)